MTQQSREGASIAVYLVLAYALAWLVTLPLWLGEGISSPWYLPVAMGMMFTPAIAALIVVFFVERPKDKARALGLMPYKPLGRFFLYLGLGLVVPILLSVVAIFVGALLGVYPADFVNFSWLRALLDEQMAAAGADAGGLDAVPIQLFVVLQFVNILIFSVLNLVPALGEEIGWRGWLLPKLMRLGTVPALLISGVIWGLWHAPVILLGHNYPDAPGWLAMLVMTGLCIVIGAVFGWLRMRSESVWPAALAHASFNAAAGSTIYLFAAEGAYVDTTQATVMGWTGWIVPLVLVIVLIATGQFRPKPTEKPLPDDSRSGLQAG